MLAHSLPSPGPALAGSPLFQQEAPPLACLSLKDDGSSLLQGIAGVCSKPVDIRVFREEDLKVATVKGNARGSCRPCTQASVFSIASMSIARSGEYNYNVSDERHDWCPLHWKL